MPQLFVQSAVVAAELVPFDTIVTSLTLSILSIAYAATLKVHAMYDLDKRSDSGVVAAVLAFLYFGADSASRAIAVYLTVHRHGMGIAPFAPYVGVWIGLEVVYRGLSALFDRTAAWAVDPSLTSGALALFSALPLSTNPTERRWLFATSTVVVMAAALEASWAIGDSDELAVAVAFAVCVSVKVLLFIGMDWACPKGSFKSERQYGLGAFSFDVDLSKQQAAWIPNGEFHAPLVAILASPPLNP